MDDNLQPNNNFNSKPNADSAAPATPSPQSEPSAQPQPATPPQQPRPQFQSGFRPQFQPDPAPAPESKPTQKHTGRTVALIVLGVAVLILAGLAIWYFCFYSKPEKALSDAMNNLFTAKNLEVNGEANVTYNNNSISETLSLKASQDSSLALSAKLELPNLNTSGNSQLTGDLVLSSGDQLYLKVDGISNYLTVNGVFDSLSTEAQTLTKTVAGSLENTWWQIDASDSSINNGAYQQCLTSALSSANSSSLAQFYQSHPFLNIQNYQGNLASSNFSQTAYTISLNADQLADAINSLSSLSAYNNYTTCLAQNGVDNLGTPSITSQEANVIANNTPTIVAVITNFDHRLTSLFINDSSSNTEVHGSFAYPDKLTIETPTEYGGTSELVTGVQSLLQYLYAGGLSQITSNTTTTVDLESL